MAQIKDQSSAVTRQSRAHANSTSQAPPGCIHVAVHLPKTCLSEALVKRALIKGGVWECMFSFYCENFVMSLDSNTF